MNIDLTDTTSSQINSSLVKARRAAGSPAVGMVLTLIIVTDEGNHYDALKSASQASQEHPSRILVVIKRPGRSPRDRKLARLDAEVRVGGETGTSETVLLRLHGELAHHAHSVVLPLLLPDTPVVVWWPEDAPAHPNEDLLGKLAARRITDASATEDPVSTLALRAETYTPGDTDLAWTRITPWRSVLAAALDQRHAPVESAVVEGEAYNPSSELLALWLADRLKVPVARKVSAGPGLTAVRLTTGEGEICLHRADGSLAALKMPGQPDRHVALQRRETSELIAEELRRLDPDEAFAATVRFGAGRLGKQTIQPETVNGARSAPAAGAPAAGRTPPEPEPEPAKPSAPAHRALEAPRPAPPGPAGSAGSAGSAAPPSPPPPPPGARPLEGVRPQPPRKDPGGPGGPAGRPAL
ncbi:glucose-6-phosphate dehydrogenase assembly protein OpcA [Streptomyces sp. S07_1.15]|uniref:glucose-6-phosphate dehydrogenase assembly protein OpcA n=1 Tax=Streptomyces sp. S07_1.15 TaxID=2873925 RepID=UPI001D1452F9|nr:glucose-6-phosphate dehydrogenase assembly protein OpcA [Streptomyces sp. S07_1.15]MCC3654770.1 glucose-6-phosphate dehydrogenase assembly protein OpcA [Streptomyces sp. S07_1.15]